MTTQQLGSYLRQGLALLGVIFGVLTASVTALHLPVELSTVLTVGGAVILAIEHFVSDPSTGTPSPEAQAASTAHMMTSLGSALPTIVQSIVDPAPPMPAPPHITTVPPGAPS